MANHPERGGPGQSGTAAGQSYFDDRMPGVMSYPTDGVPQGSRSTLADERARDPHVQPSDDELRAHVIAALGDAASGFEIQVEHGEVTLAGPVADDEAKRRFGDAVRRVPGVWAVDNQLRSR